MNTNLSLTFRYLFSLFVNKYKGGSCTAGSTKGGWIAADKPLPSYHTCSPLSQPFLLSGKLPARNRTTLFAEIANFTFEEMLLFKV